MDIFDKKNIRPMLIANEVPAYDDPDSFFELKYDGIRCIAYLGDEKTDLRNKKDMQLLTRFPELSMLHFYVDEKCILDGELIVTDSNGMPDFYQVQRRAILSIPYKIEIASKRYPAQFVAYDILYHKDRPVHLLPLYQRKELLNNTVHENKQMAISRVFHDGIRLFELVKNIGLEGIVGKKKDSIYFFGKRSKDWNKVKVYETRDYIAMGYIYNAAIAKTSLIIGEYDEKDNLVITGHVTLGVNVARLQKFGIQPCTCPLGHPPQGYTSAHWFDPVVCEIQYMPTKGDSMRQPVLKCFSDDISAEEFRLSQRQKKS